MSHTIIKARIVDQTVQLANEALLASGSVDVLQISCDFCSLWDGYGKTAVFYRDRAEVYHIPLVDGVATVPHEVLANEGSFYFGVFGVFGVADNVRTTEEVRIDVVRGAITTATAETKKPTPGIYTQILAAYGALESGLQVERARINNLAQAVTPGSTSGDAELADARVGYDGTVYESAGEAVRSQIKNIQESKVMIDDTTVGTDVWSSKNTVDKLCPVLAESGSIVTCEPVDGYPLGVVTHIPASIAGVQSIELIHSGRNLLPADFIKFEDGTATGDGYLLRLPPGKYYVWAEPAEGYPLPQQYTYLLRSIDGGATWPTMAYLITANGGGKYSFTIAEGERWMLWLGENAKYWKGQFIQVEQGNAKTEKAPYGTVNKVEFASPVNGGTYDWTAGELTEDHLLINLSDYTFNDNNPGVYNGTFYAMIPEGSPAAANLQPCLCSHFLTGSPRGAYDGGEPDSLSFSGNIIYVRNSTYMKAADFNQYLAEQKATGTPLMAVYKRKEPNIIQLEPQDVTALTGVNNLYTDVGETEVTGRADPNAVIQDLYSKLNAVTETLTALTGG